MAEKDLQLSKAIDDALGQEASDTRAKDQHGNGRHSPQLMPVLKPTTESLAGKIYHAIGAEGQNNSYECHFKEGK